MRKQLFNYGCAQGTHTQTHAGEFRLGFGVYHGGVTGRTDGNDRCHLAFVAQYYDNCCCCHMKIHSELSMQVIAAYQLCLWLREISSVWCVSPWMCVCACSYIATHTYTPALYINNNNNNCYYNVLICNAI